MEKLSESLYIYESYKSTEPDRKKNSSRFKCQLLSISSISKFIKVIGVDIFIQLSERQQVILENKVFCSAGHTLHL